MYSANYNERFTNQNNSNNDNSNSFAAVELNFQSETSNNNNTQTFNPTFFNNSNSNDEFEDDDIEMLWDDDEVTDNSINYVNLDNTQVVETTKEEVVPEVQNNVNVAPATEPEPVIQPEPTSVSDQMPVMDTSIENNYINNRRANKLCIFAIVSVLIYFIPIIGVYAFRVTPGFFQDFFLVFSSIANLFPVLSLCLVIYTKTKYPFNKFVNVLIYVYIAIFIVFVIIYLIYIFSCIGDIPTCFNFNK